MSPHPTAKAVSCARAGRTGQSPVLVSCLYFLPLFSLPLPYVCLFYIEGDYLINTPLGARVSEANERAKGGQSLHSRLWGGWVGRPQEIYFLA